MPKQRISDAGAEFVAERRIQNAWAAHGKTVISGSKSSTTTPTADQTVVARQASLQTRGTLTISSPEIAPSWEQGTANDHTNMGTGWAL